ncbi:MAG: hypothetical protein GVY07_01525 [Bacteroidetes bacterium]|jgi:hypothetical protein|nr:hypothetical protein [Bacteroidota bacterium]
MKIKKQFIYTFLLAFFLTIGVQSTTSTSCIQANDLPKQCAEDGYSTWDGWFWNPDGKDCWCNDRNNVVSPCSTQDDDLEEN